MVEIKLNSIMVGVLPQAPYEFIYTIYRKYNKRADLMNIGSIVDKFTADALVNLGYITDDNTDIIKKVTIIDGGVDKNNPHAKLEIRKYERM